MAGTRGTALFVMYDKRTESPHIQRRVLMSILSALM